MNDSVSLSRATSVSRGSSKHGSALSRQQSLIKKNIAPHDLRPSDILIERFTAWKIILKQLIAYFEGLADIENNIAKEMTKLGAVIQVPFRAGNQFLGEGGLQDVYYQIRDKTRAIADQHANLGRTIDGSIVQHLQKLKVEIKAHIRNIQNDTGKLATSVAKERELSAKFIGDLGTNISILKNTPMSVTAKTDPYVANQLVYRQLVKQVHTENALQKSLLLTQSSSALFESSLIQALQSAWATYEEWRSRMDSSIQDIWKTLERSMGALAPDREWIAFAAREDHLIDPETPLRDVENIHYPSKDDPSVLPVHTGLIERKKRYTRTYREGYYVLTPAGFLHEYTSSDPALADKPVFSLFLPLCTLGPPSAPSVPSHKFHIEGRKDGTGSVKTGSFKNLAGSLTGRKGSGPAWTFRGRSHDDMMEWWNDIRMLCARYLVASESIERSGPVAAAVRAVGYVSEEEGDDSEGEGSSVEEERDQEDEEIYQQARGVDHGEEGEEDLPQYEHARQGNGNGHSVDKKPYPEHGYDHDESAAGGHATNVVRKSSLRQQEKAPEGRAPHVPHEDDPPAGGTDTDDEYEPAAGAHAEDSGNEAGPAPTDSRYTENL
ncbi:uncharacterized protein PHACADRAFT_252780 [Phanerochaete carnosa HHB-10118-sp]|uniref:PH domain-containing protein n=1 Tax=Phanerochaete carnosa (strain HHB-10118-sp) TaxID=650164 RepID=K5V6U9_PHACS|nr:uncharacterized protein PHACADRAFT_252780 [Phanerochaete carnosa HHB-10118-sp]EKM58451.1 hypothetical protein PHACADRAFT_252780 [Phanerochaete carnosa HHB-10118-sp]